ncbi:MAG: phosphate ABC transporter permease PstA [Firmicutes bacterium]|nr:phosphate ABC transporter permease PstA [Bacillota bacterium]
MYKYGANTRRKKSKFNLSLVFKILSYIFAVIAIAALVGLIIYILVRGLPHLTGSFLTNTEFERNFETLQTIPTILPATITTLIMIALTIVISLPLGIASAVFLNEYMKPGSKIVKYLRMATDTLTGVPSVVYGMFGAMFFGGVLGLGMGIWTGVFTMAIILLPITIRATEESLKTVPLAFREGSYALGATKQKTIFKIVLPGGMPGIVTSAILGMGRVIGESAAILFTVGTSAQLIAPTLNAPTTNLAGMLVWFSRGGYFEQAAATAAMLLMIVIVLNVASTLVGRRLMKNRGAANS